MVKVNFDSNFEKKFLKIKDKLLQIKVYKQIEKITKYPEIGKPMRYFRRDTREVYVQPYRISYAYNKDLDEITFLDLYHKDEQ